MLFAFVELTEPFMMGIIVGGSAMALVWMFVAHKNSKTAYIVKQTDDDDEKHDPADWWKRG